MRASACEVDRRRSTSHLLVHLDEGELGCAINGDQQVKLALFGPDFGNVDVEKADRMDFEFPLDRGLAFDLRQLRNALPLQTAVQRGSGQMRQAWLKSVQAIPNHVRDRAATACARGRRPRSPPAPARAPSSRLLGPGRSVGDRRAALPLGARVLVHPVPLREGSQVRLTMMCRSTDRLSRRGAPMENLAHSTSFQSKERIAPSKPGIKHLVSRSRPTTNIF